MNTSQKTLKISSLPFDSSLFGYPVGKCIADGTWNEQNFLTQAQEYHLVYIFAMNPIFPYSDRIQAADIKLTFNKELKNAISSDSEILPYVGLLSEPLLSLALESGIFSRFYTDSKFIDSEFEKLYRIWIQNAVERNEVLITEDFSGFVSCAVSDNTAEIGLIAVDKNKRGKGWARRLMHAAERRAFLLGAKSLTVSTQENNIPASILYKSLGYSLKERMYIYHFWNL